MTITGRHALIIDDDASNRKVLDHLLSLEGFTRTELASARGLEKALEKLDEVTLIFLDLEMPGTNGYQALEVFKSKPEYSDIPVVAYSVHRNEFPTARALGFHSFLAKPLDSDRFSEQLASILNGEHVWAV
jgi:CheY-like chemotaxis protein